MLTLVTELGAVDDDDTVTAQVDVTRTEAAGQIGDRCSTRRYLIGAGLAGNDELSRHSTGLPTMRQALASSGWNPSTAPSSP